MEAFNQLRTIARAKRDRIIEQARTDCEKSLAAIESLERELSSKPDPTGRTKSLRAYIVNAIPTDRPFTSRDILQALETTQPWRLWSIGPILSAVAKLRARSIIKRHGKRHGGNELTQYVVVGANAGPADPFADITFRDAIYAVVQGKSLTLTEINVALLESGWRSVMSPKDLREHIAKVLRKDSRFRREGERWTT
jgi:hypothetical protein